MDGGVDEGAEAVIFLRKDIDDSLDLAAVGEFDGGSGGVDEDFLEEVTGDFMRLGERELFEIGDIVEG